MVTDPQRSELMKRVRQRDTAPELAVRRILTSIGARYRVNVTGLPGSPDIANRLRRKAIFVHGCFWHFHADCPRGTVPSRNSQFWRQKLLKNRERDRTKIRDLQDLGFRVRTVWECELADLKGLTKRLERFWTE